MANVYAFESSLVMMIAATFVLAGMVKGVTGMGLPTVAMGILGSLISPVAAAAMLLLPSLISNLFQFGSGGNTRQLLKRLWPMLLTVVVATLLASAWITGGDTTRTQFALGVALVAYAICPPCPGSSPWALRKMNWYRRSGSLLPFRPWHWRWVCGGTTRCPYNP